MRSYGCRGRVARGRCASPSVAEAPRAATDGANHQPAARPPTAGAAAAQTAMEPGTPKQHKSRRKISLPWFRQSSVSAPHATLSRQHTIDTPSSFHARLMRGRERTRQVMQRESASAAAAQCTKRAPSALHRTAPTR